MLSFLYFLAAFLIIILLGLLTGLSLAPHFFLPVLFISFAIFLYILLRSTHWLQALLLGYFFTLSSYLSTMYYLTLSLMGATNNNFQASLNLYAKLFWIAVSVYFIPGLAGLLTWLIPVRGYKKIILFAIFWSLGAWYLGSVLSAPVGFVGYIFGFSDALAQAASLVGIYGLTFLAVLMGSAPAIFFLEKRRKTQGIFLGTIALCILSLYSWGTIRLYSAKINYWPEPTLRLVQTNVAYEDKVKHFYQEFNKLIRLSIAPAASTKPRYIIWPESALNEIFAENLDLSFKSRHAFLHFISMIAPPNGAILLGLDRIVLTKASLQQKRKNEWEIPKTEVQYLYNSLLVIDHDKRLLTIYDQVNLIPFGEYKPLYDFASSINLLNSLRVYSPYKNLDYRFGKAHQTVVINKNLPAFSPLICYEQLFSGDVIAKNNLKPAWLLVIANDYWFRNTVGIYQFLEGARFRAIEEGIPLIRVANAGISGIFDPYGRMLKALKPGEENFLDTKIPLFLANKPLYAMLHQWSFFLLILIALGLVFYPSNTKE